MRLLSIDIENSPHLVWTYKLWGNSVYIPPEMVVQESQIMCFAAKWIGENSDPMFFSTYHNGRGGMIDEAWHLLNEADALVHFNGDRFDDPKIKKELLVAGYDAPAPYKNVDLYKIVKQQFDFPYKRLDEVAKALGLTGKIGSHKANWKLCLENDPDAWEREKEYNIQDVVLNEKLFNILQPWIGGGIVPSVAVDQGIDACRCGSTNLTKEGFRQTLTGKYQRYRCNTCGTWLKDNKRVAASSITPEPR